MADRPGCGASTRRPSNPKLHERERNRIVSKYRMPPKKSTLLFLIRAQAWLSDKWAVPSVRYGGMPEITLHEVRPFRQVLFLVSLICTPRPLEAVPSSSTGRFASQPPRWRRSHDPNNDENPSEVRYLRRLGSAGLDRRPNQRRDREPRHLSPKDSWVRAGPRDGINMGEAGPLGFPGRADTVHEPRARFRRRPPAAEAEAEVRIDERDVHVDRLRAGTSGCDHRDPHTERTYPDP